MRTVSIIVLLAFATTASGQYYRSSGQAYSYASGSAVKIERNPGPAHPQHCTMCLGNHLISSHSYSFDYLNQVGYQQWQTLHDNAHNPAVRIYAPTPQCVIAAMLRYAELKPGMVFVDLGSGDGRVVVTAAWQTGCRAVGVELDDDKIEVSRKLAEDYGVSHLATFIKADVLNVTVKKADAVYVYLESSTLAKLEPAFREMRQGAKLISYQHKIKCQYLDPEHNLFFREVE